MPKKSRDDLRVRANEPCPCDSGKNYGSCCWKKAFEFRRNRKGGISKVIPLSGEMVDLLKAQLEEFKGIFGRAPRGKEPVFFHKYLYSEDDSSEQFRRAARAADFPPEFLYATEKTDRIVTEENWKLLTAQEQKEWTDAIDEFFERREAGTLDHSPIPEEQSRAFGDLIRDLYAAICHVGAFLEKCPRSKLSDISFLQYYFAARTLDTLRTVHRWLEERYSDDVWMLLRVIYESYLKFAYMRCAKDAPGFFFALAGIRFGTHEYAKTRNGKTDYRKIVNVATGATVKNVSNREMISSTGVTLDIEIFEELYAFLSSYSHMGLDANLQYFDRHAGFLVHKDDNPFHALQWASVIVTLWFEELAQISFLKKQTGRDLRYMANRIRGHTLALFDLADTSKQMHLVKLVHRRLRRSNAGNG